MVLISLDVNFILWHYSQAIIQYFHNWWLRLKKINHFFSLPSLFLTLFYPWKRMVVSTNSGFNLQKFFENITFNLISVSIGFVVRIMLIIFCLVLIIFISLFQIIGFIFYLIFPLISFPSYVKFKNHQASKLSFLLSRINSNPDKADTIILESVAGKFILKHLNSAPKFIAFFKNLIISANEPISTVDNFESYFKQLLSQNPKNDEELSGFNLTSTDIILAARWWDLINSSSVLSDNIDLGRPGIGINLTYGYSVNLDRYSEDLSLVDLFHHRLIGRTNVVSRIKTVLESGRNVILIGDPGVGRMTVVFEFTYRLITGQLGNYFNGKRVLKLDYQSILAEGDIEVKRQSFKNSLIEAKNAGNIVLVIKELQRLTNTNVSGYDFTDLLDDVLSDSRLPVIALCNLDDYQRYISHDRRIKKYFDAVEVVAPTKDEAMDILLTSAYANEKKYNLIFTISCLRKLLDGSDRFISDIPFPEKVLELLSELTSQKINSESKIVTFDDAVNLLSEKTKIPMVRITEAEKIKLSSIESIIHQKLIGQEAAIELIGKSLRARSVGLKNEDRPIGSFLFLGPTGVGKTETAKVLSEIYFGDNQPILRFDMAEYIGPEGFSRLIGSVSQNRVGNLTTAIKESPSSLLLLDEIEKAPKEIFNLLLTLLDEGYLTDVYNKKIKCSNLFVIATSNAAAEFIRQSVAQGITGEGLQQRALEYIQQNNIFVPELLNRFDGVVVFEPLTNDNLQSVTKLMLQKLQQNLKSKNIFMEYDEFVVKKLVDENYDPTLGARPIRRAIDLVLSDIISRPILNNQITGGDKINITAGTVKNEYIVNKI